MDSAGAEGESLTLSFHSSLTGATELSWEEEAEIAGGTGFDAIDLDLWELGDRNPDSVRAVMDQHGLGAGAASLPVEFRKDEASFENDLTELPRRAELAAAVGVKVLSRSIPSSSQLPREEALPLFRGRLVRCMDILRRNGLRLAVEMLGPLHLRRQDPFELVTNLTECAEFADSCGPDVGVLTDSWHWHHVGGTESDLADLGGRIFQVHIADAPDLPAEAIRDEKRLLPGQGVVDFPKFWGGVNAAGYHGLVTPEVHGYSCSKTPLACAADARAAIESALPRPTAIEQVPPPPPPPPPAGLANTAFRSRPGKGVDCP